MKKRFQLQCLVALMITLPIYVYAQSGPNPADLSPVQKQKYKRSICQPCEKFATRYNEYVDEMYNEQLELRAIETSIYEDEQFIERDKQNIDSIRAKGGPNVQKDLQTAYKVLRNDEEDHARHQSELEKTDKHILLLNNKEDIMLERLQNCEKKCGATTPRTSMAPMPGSSYYATAGTPNNLAGWYGHVGWDYQQFSNNGSSFAESSTNKTYNVDTNYHSGFNLGIGHQFIDRSNDISLDYEHLRTSDSSTAWAPSLTLEPNAAGPVNWSKSSLVFQYDSVDLTAGHKTEMTNNFSLYFYGGLNYTHLTKDMTIYGNGLGNSVYNQVGTSFNGWGPVFGVDATVTPCERNPNFNIFGGVRSSFSYGTMTGYVKTNVNDTYTADSIPNSQIVVPGIGAKLGLGYDLPYKNSIWNFQLGYKLNEYFGVTNDTTYNNTINASFQGPYFNVGIGF